MMNTEVLSKLCQNDIKSELINNLNKLLIVKEKQSNALSNLVCLVDIQDETSELIYILRKLGKINIDNYTPTKLLNEDSIKYLKTIQSESLNIGISPIKSPIKLSQ